MLFGVRQEASVWYDFFFSVRFELFGTNKKLIKRVSVRRHHWTLMVYARVHSATMNSNYMFECESIRFYVLKWIFFVCVAVAIGLLLRSQSISCSWCMTALCLRAIWYLVCWVFIHYSNLTIFLVLEFVICHFFVDLLRFMANIQWENCWYLATDGITTIECKAMHTLCLKQWREIRRFGTKQRNHLENQFQQNFSEIHLIPFCSTCEQD